MTATSTSPKSAAPHRYESDPLYHLGRWVHAHRWWVIALWAAALAVALSLAPGAARVLSPGGFSTNRLAAQRATGEIQRALGANPAAALGVFHSPTVKTTQ